MRTPLLLTPLLPCLLLLASCSSPPKPPSVDGSKRQPVNASAAIEAQACRHELHNARLAAAESARAAETSTATLAYLTARLRTMAFVPGPVATPADGNRVFRVHFDFGSAQFKVPEQDAEHLLAQARLAPLILLRGRTDGIQDSAAESRIARERADAVRDYLVSHGVAPSRIRTTYQPAGDRLADNESESGRRLNRRVEIEIYRALPTAVGTATVAT